MRKHPHLVRLILCALVCALCFGLCLPGAAAVTQEEQAAAASVSAPQTLGRIANCDATSVRIGPGSLYSPLGQAVLGEEFAITQPYFSPFWHQIAFQGRVGYVQVACMELVDPDAPTPTVILEPTPTPSPEAVYGKIVNCNVAVVMRSGPAASFDVVELLPLGSEFQIIQQFCDGGEWHQISRDGQTGYVNVGYVEILAAPTPTATQAPTPTPTPTATQVATPTPTPTPTATQAPTPTPTPTATQAPTPTPTPTATQAPTPTPAAVYGEVVNCNTAVTVRIGPSSVYDALGSLSLGSTCQIVQQYYSGSNWHQILYNGQTAYVFAYYIRILDDAPTPTPTKTATPTPTQTPDGTVGRVYNCTTVNVRSGPGTSYDTLGKLNVDDTLPVTKAYYTAEWHQVLYNGQTAYVYADYLYVPGATPDLPGYDTYRAVAYSAKMSVGQLVGDNGDYDTVDSWPTTSTYKLVVDLTNQACLAYKKDASGNYTDLVRVMICSSGSSSTPTPTGTFKLGYNRYRFGHFVNFGDCYGQYWSQVTGSIYLHSIIYNRRYATPDTLSVTSYRNLGTAVSHGCIRLTVPDARWIFNNMGPGSTCQVTYRAKDSALRAAVKLPAYTSDWS